MGAAKAVLGEDGVYAASDGKGHVLVELGSNDQQALTQAAEDLAGAVGDGVSAAHLVSEGGFQQG
jgi:deferrochelatase/peroxidase EfeB